MKKLSMAVVLMAAGVTFANAQSKEAQKKVAVETAQVAELKADTSTVTTKADVVRAEEAQLARPQSVQIETAATVDARRDPAVEKQKAIIKKEEAKKAESKK